MNSNVEQLTPVKHKRSLLPELSPQAELALLCRVLFREGFDDHLAGHISYKQPDGTMLVNPWELTWDEVTAEDVIRIDETGKVIEGHWNVTPAVNLHLEVHARREDVGVIIHNHPRYGTIWADAQRIPPAYDQTAALVNGDIVLYDEYNSAVNEAGEGAACAEAFGNAKWGLLANHGVLVVANDIRQAHLRAITLEWRCRQAWHVEAIGGGRPVRDEVVDSLGGMVDGSGFPFLWEAMARRELRSDPGIVGD